MNKSEYHRKKYKIRKKFESVGDWFGECPYCGNPKFFYDRYDAFCCMECDIWFDAKCGDAACPYCSNRPESPSKAILLEEFTSDKNKDWRRSNYAHKKMGENKHFMKREFFSQIQDNRK